jgi:hypothetical protein
MRPCLVINGGGVNAERLRLRCTRSCSWRSLRRRSSRRSGRGDGIGRGRSGSSNRLSFMSPYRCAYMSRHLCRFVQVSIAFCTKHLVARFAARHGGQVVAQLTGRGRGRGRCKRSSSDWSSSSIFAACWRFVRCIQLLDASHEMPASMRLFVILVAVILAQEQFALAAVEQWRAVVAQLAFRWVGTTGRSSSTHGEWCVRCANGNFEKNGRAEEERPRKGTVGRGEGPVAEEGRERKRCRRVSLASSLPAPLCAWLVHGWLPCFDVFLLCPWVSLGFGLLCPACNQQQQQQQSLHGHTTVRSILQEGQTSATLVFWSGLVAASRCTALATAHALTSSDLFVAVGSSSPRPSSRPLDSAHLPLAFSTTHTTVMSSYAEEDRIKRVQVRCPCAGRHACVPASRCVHGLFPSPWDDGCS